MAAKIALLARAAKNAPSLLEAQVRALPQQSKIALILGLLFAKCRDLVPAMSKISSASNPARKIVQERVLSPLTMHKGLHPTTGASVRRQRLIVPVEINNVDTLSSRDHAQMERPCALFIIMAMLNAPAFQTALPALPSRELES
jgi:hypothetical protein